MPERDDDRRRTVVRQSGELLGGERPGNRRLRAARPKPLSIPVPARMVRKSRWHPALVFIYGFAGLILIGTLILSLPFATADGQRAPLLTALFTATSAVCVTGLVVVDTGTYWSGFGQAVILVLIQLGGFGFMTSSTLLFLLIGRQITLRERVLISAALGTRGLETTVSVVRGVFYLTLIAEVIGAVVLAVAFWGQMEASQAVWWAAFHSVSAFNNAGFDVTGGFQSLVAFNDQPLVVLPVAVLIITGGISFAVIAELIQRRRTIRLGLDTRLVLVTSCALLVLGMVGLMLTELVNRASLGAMAPGPFVLNAFFMSVTARTAGFTTVDVAGISEGGSLILMALMIIGGAAGSTAGGIKVQTFSLLLFATISAARGSTEVQAFRRRVPVSNILRAIAVASLALALVFVVSLALSATEDSTLLHVLFEAFSAFGTVGLSKGITPDLTSAGQLIVIVTMFAGRLGPLTLVYALASRERRSSYRWPEESVKIG